MHNENGSVAFRPAGRNQSGRVSTHPGLVPRMSGEGSGGKPKGSGRTGAVRSTVPDIPKMGQNWKGKVRD